MGCFIVCARPVEFHQKMHNFVKKRNLSLLWLSPFSKMERPYGGPKDLGFFAFFFISVVISGWRGISPALGALKHTNRSRWAFSPSYLPTTYPKPLSPVCPIEILIFGGFCLVFVFWRWSWSHGVGYCVPSPVWFSQSLAEHVLGLFWLNITTVNRRWGTLISGIIFRNMFRIVY